MNKKEWTIKELADYCGTSKTSINRVIKELEIEPTVQGNKNIIDYEDADRIVLFCRGFGLNCAENKTSQTTANQNETNQTNSSKTENVENTDFSSSSIVFENSKNDNDFFVKFLMEQIKEKDRQIAMLQEDNKLLIQSQSYVIKQLELLKQLPQTETETAPKEETKEEEPTKKHWWSRKKK